MKIATTAIAALALAATLAAVTPALAWQPELPEGCIIEIHQADWTWYRTCVNAKDPSCPVYTETQNGNHVSQRCVGQDPAVAAAVPCIPTSGNLEETYLCVTLKDAKCPVYTTGPAGRHCVPDLP